MLAELKREWTTSVSLAALATAWVVVKTWDNRNADWTCYVACRVAFVLFVGVFISSPLRQGINYLSTCVSSRHKGELDQPDNTGSSREVKVATYSWEDDGKYIKVSVPMDPETIASISDDDVETVITPLSLELRIRARGLV